MIAVIVKVCSIGRKRVSIYPSHFYDAPNLFLTNRSRLQSIATDTKGEISFVVVLLMSYWFPFPPQFLRCSCSPCISIVAPNPFSLRSMEKLSLMDDIYQIYCIFWTKDIRRRHYWLLMVLVSGVFCGKSCHQMMWYFPPAIVTTLFDKSSKSSWMFQTNTEAWHISFSLFDGGKDNDFRDWGWQIWCWQWRGVGDPDPINKKIRPYVMSEMIRQQ